MTSFEDEILNVEKAGSEFVTLILPVKTRVYFKNSNYRNIDFRFIRLTKVIQVNGFTQGFRILTFIETRNAHVMRFFAVR